jgi:D-xylose 1-dehydrogenase (NADP+, D-xylono-1,5-lactone-forming)
MSVVVWVAMMRFGILGTGSVVVKHIEAARLAGLDVVAIASRDRQRAQAFGLPRAYSGYAELLNDSDVDVVINALHNGLHCEWTCRALEAGKHVLCEKPLGCNPVEVERMTYAAQKAGKLLMEGFMYRFHPQMSAILDRLPDIGRLVHISSHRLAYGRDRGNPRYSAAAGGGALLDIGCYCVNFSRAVAGEPTHAEAVAHFVNGVDLTLSGMMEFPRNVTAQFCCSMEAEPSFGAEIIGTDGKITIPHPWMPPIWPTEFAVVRAQKVEVVRVHAADVPQHVLVGFARQLTHFVECAQANREPLINALDSTGNARAIQMLMDSARSRQP